MSAVSALRPSSGRSPPGGPGGGSPFAVVAAAHFESGPPVSKIRHPSIEDGEIVEVCQEEAWEERKKKTTTTTKNIERRVQRQVVLEDGNVVEDTGAVTTEDVTEDTVIKEVNSDEKQRPQGQLEIAPLASEGWVAIPGAVVISEKETKTVNSHDEVTDELETEEVQHCGDVTNQEAEAHLAGKENLQSLISHRQATGSSLALTKAPQKRVVYENTRKKGTKDTVNVKENSRIQDGHVTTDTERCVQHEKYSNESAPDDGSSLSDGSVHEARKETSHNLVHTKDEDLLEYYAVPKGGTIAQGVKLGEGMHVVSEDVHEDRQGDEGDKEAAEKVRRVRRPQRRDALTKKPLDYNQEEVVRKKETDRWLEHHFGSESGRSGTSSREASIDGHSSGGNRITITMSPRPASPEDVVDRGTTSNRRWRDSGISVSQVSNKTPAAPPPPPKPDRLWASSPIPSSNSVPLSPISPQSTLNRRSSGRTEIQESELTAARARLKSTGRSLTEEDNKENDEPFKDSYDTAPIKVSRRGRRETSGKSLESATIKIEATERIDPTGRIDPVYSSRFRSGKPRYSYREDSPDRAPPPLPSTPPPSNVGRSQSFNVQTLPWSSKHKDNHSNSYVNNSYSTTSHSTMHNNSSTPTKLSKVRTYSKEYRSTDQLDNVGNNRYTNYSTVDRSNPSADERRTKYKYSRPLWDEQRSEPRSEIRSEPRSHTRSEMRSEMRSEVRSEPRSEPRSQSKSERNDHSSSKKKSKKGSPPPRRRSPDAKSLIRRLFGSHKDSSSREARRETRHETHDSDHDIAREAGTQTATPVPPPRTKRKKPRPKSCYFFGQESATEGMSGSSVNGSMHGGRSRDHSFSESTYVETNKTERYQNRSPKVERRYRTTTTITPVITTQRQSNGHHDYENREYIHSTPKASWTNTVDPRRRPRVTAEEERPQTLPRKLSNNFTSPRKTYIFGEDSPSRASRDCNDYNGSSQNVSIHQTATTERQYTSLNDRMNMNNINGHLTKPVGRSQSFNVQPGQGQFKRHEQSSTMGRPLSTSNRNSQYQSSPYLNLQSPNLIANIARSSSINRKDSLHNQEQESAKQNGFPEEVSDKKRESFLKGLSQDAPELFNFLHAENEDKSETSKNTQIRTETSSSRSHHVIPAPSTPSKYSAKVFTFGRSDSNTLTRTNSNDSNAKGSFTEENNKRTSVMNDQTTSMMNRQNISMNTSSNGTSNKVGVQPYPQYNGTHRKSQFNMKTPGSSLLFSPSFREKKEDDRRLSEARKRLSGDYTGNNLNNFQQHQLNQPEGSPVIIQVRDWNMR